MAVLMVVPHHNSKVSFLCKELPGSHGVMMLCPSTSRYPPMSAEYWALRCKDFNTVTAARDPRVSLFPPLSLHPPTLLSVPGPPWASVSWCAECPWSSVGLSLMVALRLQAWEAPQP